MEYLRVAEKEDENKTKIGTIEAEETFDETKDAEVSPPIEGWPDQEAAKVSLVDRIKTIGQRTSSNRITNNFLV